MTTEILEQQIALSLQRLEELWQRAEKLSKVREEQWQQANEGPAQHQQLLMESLEELSNSLEELQVTIEELHQQNEQLAQSHMLIEAERRRYQELFEFAPDAYLVTSNEGAILEANQMAVRLLNLSQKRLVGKVLVVFISAEERGDFYSKLSQLQRGESVKNWRVQIQRRRGACFTASLNVAPVQNLQGQVARLRWRILELSPDVEEERDTEAEVFNTASQLPITALPPHPSVRSYSSIPLQSEYLSPTLFEKAAKGVALMDSQGRVIKSNRTLQEMLGYGEEELQAVFPKLLGLDEESVESKLFQQLMAGQYRSYQLEKRLFDRNISMQWGRLTVTLMEATNEEPTFATCVLEDLTQSSPHEAEREQTDEEKTPPLDRLLETERQQLAPSVEQVGKLLNKILSASPNGYLICDRAGKYIYVNQAAAQLLGFAQSEFIGKTWRQLGFPAEIMERFDTQREAVFATGKPITDETHFPTVDGIGDYEYTISPFGDINSDPEAVVVTVKDITKHKQTAVAANTALAKEEELSAIKSRLACVVSHELRNPLNNIFACAKLVASYSNQKDDEKKHNYLQRIQVNVKRINQLLDDLLLIGKVESGQLMLNPSLLDLAKFCRELIEELQQGAGQNHKLTLVGQSQHSSACMDEKLLRHTLLNLLLNAIMYSPKNSEIQLDVVCQGRQAIFRIQDSGIGIPQEERDFLFQAFHRGSHVGEVVGSSLGLAIVKQCVDLQGGEIAVESEQGVGTTLIVKLPLIQRSVKRGN
jgi:PAS domain S-box-containing protein